MVSSKNKLPDGWNFCSKFGTVVEGTNIIPLKTPFQELYPLEEFINEQEKLGLKVKTIIDLTDTNRYYTINDIPKGITYIKIPVSGKEAPDKKLVKNFIEKINENKEGYIGVHCTHGMNRTGFLVASYLIETFNIKVSEAIEIFNKARKDFGFHKIEYIDILFSRYNQNNDSMFKNYSKYPPTPVWSKHYHKYLKLIGKNVNLDDIKKEKFFLVQSSLELKELRDKIKHRGFHGKEQRLKEKQEKKEKKEDSLKEIQKIQKKKEKRKRSRRKQKQKKIEKTFDNLTKIDH